MLMARQDFVAAKKTVKRAQALLEVAAVHASSPNTEPQDLLFGARRQQANMLRICKANLEPGSKPDTASALVRPLCLNNCD